MANKVPYVLAVAASLCLLVVGPLLVTAQNSASQGQGLEISPPLIERDVDPGESLEVDIKVRNVTAGTVTTTAQVDDFVAAGEDGQPKLLLEEDAAEAEESPYSLKEWVSGVPDLTLVSQEVKTAKVSINVPADASPGGHYGVVRFTATPADAEGTAVSLSASIGSLILLRVSGDIVEQASIQQFSSGRINPATEEFQATSFFETAPVSFLERVQNSGNVHFKPAGSVIVKNLFGQEVAKLTVNENGGNVLPSSVRKFEQTLEDKVMFGRYSADLELTYGQGQTLSQSISFWVIPYKIVLAVLAGIILLVLLIRWTLHHYKKSVLNSANKN